MWSDDSAVLYKFELGKDCITELYASLDDLGNDVSKDSMDSFFALLKNIPVETAKKYYWNM